MKRGVGVSRRSVLAAAGAGVVGLHAPAVLGQAKSKYAGTTIHGSAFSLPFHTFLRGYFPEFEEKTGIKVSFDVQAFPVYNQRMDLELSTGGSAYDVILVTFIYQGRWIGAGWVTDLDEFTKDPNATPADWDPADFVSGAQSSLRDDKGHTYGFGVEAGAMLLYAGRGDLIEKAGLQMPATMDDLMKVCDALHGKEGVSAWTSDKLHHWNWPPYLMNMGGRIFKNPPDNLTPMLNTPEAATSAEWFTNLLMKYGPAGILSYTDDQSLELQLSGRSNMRTNSLTWGLPLAKDPNSKVKNTVRYGMVPSGPAGDFPGSNCHGFGIPSGSRNKGAAWEFIKWALSKEMLTRMVKEHGYPSICRRSVIQSEAFKEAMTLNGQDVSSLFLKVLDLGGQTGYMKYRTVPVFPQVGDKINRAIEAIATKQMSAQAALAQAQSQAVEAIKMGGYKVDG